MELDSMTGAIPAEAELPEVADRPSGPALAVVLAAGIGAFVLGLFTTLSEAVVSVHDFLPFSDAVGPLAGKTIIASSVFFGAWVALAALWRNASPPLRPVVITTIVLLVAGFVMTFPIFFQAFASE